MKNKIKYFTMGLAAVLLISAVFYVYMDGSELHGISTLNENNTVRIIKYTSGVDREQIGEYILKSDKVLQFKEHVENTKFKRSFDHEFEIKGDYSYFIVINLDDESTAFDCMGGQYAGYHSLNKDINLEIGDWQNWTDGIENLIS